MLARGFPARRLWFSFTSGLASNSRSTDYPSRRPTHDQPRRKEVTPENRENDTKDRIYPKLRGSERKQPVVTRRKLEKPVLNTQQLFDYLTLPVPFTAATKYTPPKITISTKDFFAKRPHTFENYSFLLDCQAREGDLDRVFETFELLKTKEFYKPELKIYDILLRACAIAQKPSAAEKVWTELTENNIYPEITTFNEMIQCHAMSGNIEQARKIIESMFGSIVPPNAISYTIVIKSCVKFKKLELAWEVYRDMGFQGIKPDQITYNILINACFQKGEAERAINLFGDMENRGLRPLDSTYNAMIRAFSRRPDYYATALASLEKMKGAGWKPDEYTFSALLKAASFTGDVRGSELIFREMEGEGVLPNLKHYSSLMRTLTQSRTRSAGKQEILQKAQDIYAKVLSEDFLGVFDEGAVTEAAIEQKEEDLEEIIASQKATDSPELFPVYSVESKNYAKEDFLLNYLEFAMEMSQIRLAKKIFAELPGYGLRQGSRACALMLSLSIKQGWKDSAFSYFKKVLKNLKTEDHFARTSRNEASPEATGSEHRNRTKHRSYTIMINHCFAKKDLELGLKLLRYMIVVEKLRINHNMRVRDMLRVARGSGRDDIASEIGNLLETQPTHQKPDWQQEFENRFQLQQDRKVQAKFE